MKTQKRPRWITEQRPWSEIWVGDRIVASYGIVTVTGIEIVDEKSVRFDLENQPSMTLSRSNWPIVVLGRSDA